MVVNDDVKLVDEIREMNARQMARWLTTPARSGFFFSPDDLARLGRELGVPVAPYGRANGLEQLLRGASLDGRLHEALAVARDEMAAQIEQYRELQLAALDGWIERAEATLEAWTAILEDATNFDDRLDR